MVENSSKTDQLKTRDGLGPFSDVVNWDNHCFKLCATTKDSVLTELCSLLHNTLNESDRKSFHLHLIKREELCSTGIGDGISIPHPRTPLVHLFPEPKIVFGYSPEGIEFNAADNKVVHFFFMICTSRDDIHLRILTKLSRFLRAGLTERLQSITSTQELQEIIMKLETEIQ